MDFLRATPGALHSHPTRSPTRNESSADVETMTDVIIEESVKAVNEVDLPQVV